MAIAFSAKRQGEAAEAAFLARATDLGLRLAKPWGESAPFDFIVLGAKRFHRVQVKSVWGTRARRWRSYSVVVARGKHTKDCYHSGQVDFIAILVAPERAWYIIPLRALGGRKTVHLASRHPASRRLFESYREAWSLLT